LGRITRDGVTFDSTWIDEEVGQFKDESKSLAERLHDLQQKIAEREEECKSMQQRTPSDRQGLAAYGACLDALRQTENELLAEMIASQRPAAL
jgi:hypothetical protein